MNKHESNVLAVVAGLALASALAASSAGAATPQSATSDPATAAGRAEEASAASYLLGPEDTIEVFVWKEPDISAEVMVRPDGKISLPLLNELVAAGRTPAELQQEVTEGLRRFLDDPVVSVLVREINSAKIAVLGEVQDPGRFVLRQDTDMLHAIAMAGGFTEYADRGNVVLVRDNGNGIERLKVDVNDLINGDARELVKLRANDTVYVR